MINHTVAGIAFSTEKFKFLSGKKVSIFNHCAKYEVHGMAINSIREVENDDGVFLIIRGSHRRTVPDRILGFAKVCVACGCLDEEGGHITGCLTDGLFEYVHSS